MACGALKNAETVRHIPSPRARGERWRQPDEGQALGKTRLCKQISSSSARAPLTCSALAYRLSEDGKNSVLVIEAGGSDFGPFIQMPAALAWPMSMKRYNWGYLSEPEANLNNRRITAPRGKVIGGSSSINGMVYVRGHAEDFNRWEELGASGWAYADVLPYYKRMEHSHGGEEGWRGTNGPLHVQRGGFTNPLFRAFVEAKANRRASRRRRIITAASRKASG